MMLPLPFRAPKLEPTNLVEFPELEWPDFLKLAVDMTIMLMNEYVMSSKQHF